MVAILLSIAAIVTTTVAAVKGPVIGSMLAGAAALTTAVSSWGLSFALSVAAREAKTHPHPSYPRLTSLALVLLVCSVVAELLAIWTALR